MSEQAKAIEEVAKTTGKLADLADKVGCFVSRVVGPASGEIGGILEDWARYYRYKNLLAIGDKVTALHARRRIEGKTVPIPLRSGIPMLEAASLEEDVTLQDLWARLIANSTDPNFEQPLHPSYVEIIKQMCPDEATILNGFREVKNYPILFSYQSSQDPSRSLIFYSEAEATYEGVYAEYSTWCKTLPLKRHDGARAFLDNLQRLQIVELGFDLSQGGSGYSFGVSSENREFRLQRDEYLRMSQYGEGFVEVCMKEE
ncbi:MAG: Abi-alpha family protein [Tepidisphaeraceae bacterium]|jgi:hypothetical protein